MNIDTESKLSWRQYFSLFRGSRATKLFWCAACSFPWGLNSSDYFLSFTLASPVFSSFRWFPSLAQHTLPKLSNFLRASLNLVLLNTVSLSITTFFHVFYCLLYPDIFIRIFVNDIEIIILVNLTLLIVKSCRIVIWSKLRKIVSQSEPQIFGSFYVI